MLRDVLAHCQLSDELGFDSVSFTENHFHAEGFEVSNNPVPLDLSVGLQTKRLHVGQLASYCQQPIPSASPRTSQILDHMTGGGPRPGSLAATSGGGST